MRKNWLEGCVCHTLPILVQWVKIVYLDQHGGVDHDAHDGDVICSVSIQKITSVSWFFINQKFRKLILFFTCILPDYVSHESSKEFWKNSHFEKMRAGGVKTYFGKLKVR